MPSPKIIFIAALVLGLVAAAIYAVNDTRDKQMEDGPAVINGPASSTFPSQSEVQEYVKNTISTLSPEPEQLGGTFFVTEISTYDGTGVVEYEDGHNAYTADFTYSKNEVGEIVIDSFIVRD